MTLTPHHHRLGLAGALEPAARPQDLASLVPAGTLLLVQCDDLGGMDAWARDTALGRIWAEPDVQQFLGGLRESIDRAMAGGLGMLGLAPKDLDAIAARDGGFALVDATFEGRPVLDAVLTVRFRAGAAEAAKVLEALKGAVERFTPFTFEPLELRGRKGWRVQPMGFELFVLLHGDRFLLTTTRARMEEVLKALDEGHPSPLAASPRFAAVRSRMGAERHAMLAWLDVPAIHDRVARTWPRAAAAAAPYWTGLGLDAVRAVACADVPAGTGFRSELAVTLDGRRGLFALPPMGTVDHRFARYAPADALLYGAETADLHGFARAVIDLMAKFEPGVPARVDELLGRYREALGVDLERDLLQSLGDKWAFYVGAPPGGGLLPDVAVFVTVKDKEKVDRALVALASRVKEAAALHGERAARRAPQVVPGETTFRGVRIRFAEITDRRGEPAMVAPAWAFGDDFLVLALWPHTIRNVFTEKPSLAQNEEFRRLQGEIPKTSFSATYVDTKALATWLYNLATPLLQGAQGAANRHLRGMGLRLNFEDLPSATVLAKHLTGTMFYEAMEEGAYRTGFVSPFGATLAMVPVAIGVAAGVAGVLIPRGRAEAERIERHAAEAAARAAAADAHARELAEEEKHLRRRLEELEREVAELRRLVEETERPR